MHPAPKPRHMADTPLTGLQIVREKRAELAIRTGKPLGVLHGRHRTWDRWPLTAADERAEVAA